MTFRQSKSKIAKNTLMLYCRMILTMVVGLYTSRVVLNQLGIVDYGVFNVTGGVIALLVFLQSSVGSSTQRFMNVSMATHSTEELRKVFSTAVNSHIIIGLITVILLETIGLWFLKHKLVIPEGQEVNALWVFHSAVIGVFISFISSPYNAVLVANEKMGAFAYFSILETVLRLGIVMSLSLFPTDKLRYYALLLLGLSILMRILYGIYCDKRFPETRYKFVYDIKLLRKMFTFSGWLIFGCVSDMLSSQGVNMLINIFFGPVYNATRQIAVTVQGSVSQFVSNFTVSANPQITKSYAANDREASYKLAFSVSKISVFLLLLLILPLAFNIDFVLKIWLDLVPPACEIFVILVLIEGMIRTLFNPIGTIVFATGNIRNYQLTISVIYLIMFFGTLVLYKLGFPIYSTFVLSIVLAAVGLLARLLILKFQIGFPISLYFKKVILKSLLVAIPATITMALVKFATGNQWLALIICSLSSLLILPALIWLLGLGTDERTFVKGAIDKGLVKVKSLRGAFSLSKAFSR